VIDSKRKILLFFVLSIIVPMGILSMFKLSGFANQIISTTVVAGAQWEIDRPRAGLQFINANEVGNTFKDDDLTIHVAATPDRYAENAIGNPFYGGDGLLMSLDMEATTKSSYSELFNCTFHVNDANSSIIIADGEDRNCSVVSHEDFGTVEQDANIMFAANGTSCSESRPFTWIFYDSNCVEHTLNMTVECIYRNGAVEKKVIFPIVFSVILDAGNGFSDAENISFGTYNRTVDNVDFSDLFAIQLNRNQKIDVSITPPYDTFLEYSLFDPNHVTKQQEEVNSTAVFMFDVDATGTWYIEVQQLRVQGHISEGQYSIAIMEER